MQKTKGVTGDKRLAGIIGEPILVHKTVLFDYHHKQITFDPAPESAAVTPQ